jgi:DNA repair protein RadC
MENEPPRGVGRPPRVAARGGRGDASPVRRLDAHGEEALTTEELLALVLRGRVDADALASAGGLLGRAGGLRRLRAATAPELRTWLSARPMPRRAATRLAAALALGRRVHAERLPTRRVLKTSREVFDAFHDRLRDLTKERFLTVLLDGKSRVMREDVVSEGTLTASLVHPREVFGPAIRERAGALLLVHNHPSGDPEPSPEDLEVTRRLCAVGELVGIRVLDHVVVGDGAYVSFLERGLIP